MNESIKMLHKEIAGKESDESKKRFGKESAQKAYTYHKSFPEYEATPLVSLQNLADNLGVKSIYVKDESYRFNLNAFKVLGGSYCIGKYIEKTIELGELSFQNITSEETKKKMKPVTFVTATDGNHGRGIAWTASRLGQKSVVYMPKGSAEERLKNIQKLGADAEITELKYDDAVRYANHMAEKNQWALMQDTSWEGYEEVPTWIMQGYTTMAYEITKQLNQVRPTHIFLQAGVGAMAGAITGFFADYYSDDLPVITVVEPNKADCIFKTATADDGKLHSYDGDMNTIMAGLACGEPCSIGWQSLNAFAQNFASVPDYVAAKGMRILGNPIGEDKKIISGESGALTVGFVSEFMMNESMQEIRKQIGLNEESIVLCISTEGDTDQENYRRIVWDGTYPSFNMNN